MNALAQIPVVDIDTHCTQPGDVWPSRAPAKSFSEDVQHKILHATPSACTA